MLIPAGGLISPAGMTCRVRTGQPVFVVGPSADCSTAEPAPFFGRTEAEQRACAIGALSIVTGIVVSLDGGPAVDVFTPRFFTVSQTVPFIVHFNVV